MSWRTSKTECFRNKICIVQAAVWGEGKSFAKNEDHIYVRCIYCYWPIQNTNPHPWIWAALWQCIWEEWATKAPAADHLLKLLQVWLEDVSDSIPTWTSPVHRLWVRTNVAQHPLEQKKLLIALTLGTWGAEPWAEWGFILRRVTHSALLTLLMHFWPPLHYLQKRTYRHTLVSSVCSIHGVKTHLSSCL